MNWKKLCVCPTDTLLDALGVINMGACQLALVTSPEHKLLGVLSDGDMRRAMLNGHNLTTPVSLFMSTKPITVLREEGEGVALLRLRQHQLRHIPVLDADGHMQDLWSMEELLDFTVLPYPVVIMAGGLGSRLAPLTDDLPKPMLPVGGQPLLELTMQHLLRQGFRQFYIPVNYKAEKIINYFGDGSNMGASITYLHESKRLGTVGALSLLPPQSLPCIVMNGDILTRMNFAELMRVHEEKKAQATIVTRNHAIQIPYGVVCQNEEGYLSSIEEKPQHSFAISAGINVLSPEVFAHIPSDTFFDMPDLFAELLRLGKKMYVHEVQDYWLDIGRISDYHRANEDIEHCWRS